MKVLSINSVFFSPKKAQPQKYKANQADNNLKINDNNSNRFNYPKNYRPYFGARLNRTPENFYEQDFNIQNMPATVKELLLKDLENKKKRPMELQREAFADLELCWNIKDVMDVFPNEPLMQNLETLETIRPTHGYLCDLRILGAKNNTVLKSGEDLTVYLLKKIYLQGKDLAEINEDFKKDVKEDYLDEEHYKNGYFLYTTLNALGVKFPDNAYWHSLQATRLDKEYIPSTRTFDPTKERKTRVYTPREITPEERQKRSERMVLKWADMSPVQRANMLEKMRLGQIEKNGIFFDYMSPIMILAAEKAKLSDKLIEFFRKDADIEYPADLSNLNDKQSRKLKKFWDKNPYLKKQFSNAIIESMKLFEEAKALNDGTLTQLVDATSKIKLKNELRAKLRENSSKEGIKRTLINTINAQCACFPESYKNSYLDYILKNNKYKKTIMPLLAQLVYQPDNENLNRTTQKLVDELHNEYVLSHKHETSAAHVAVASLLYEYTGDATVFTAPTQGINVAVANSGFETLVLSRKAEIESRMTEYKKGFSEEELSMHTQVLMNMMKAIAIRGYATLSNPQVRARVSKLPKICKKLDKDKIMRKELKEFLKDYEGYMKFGTSPLSNNQLRAYLYESIIDDYIIYTGM